MPSLVGTSPPSMAMELSSKVTAQNLYVINQLNMSRLLKILRKTRIFLKVTYRDRPSGKLGPAVQVSPLSFSLVLTISPLTSPPMMYIWPETVKLNYSKDPNFFISNSTNISSNSKFQPTLFMMRFLTNNLIKKLIMVSPFVVTFFVKVHIF